MNAIFFYPTFLMTNQQNAEIEQQAFDTATLKVLLQARRSDRLAHYGILANELS